jgi:hypothetical protein
VGYKDLVANAVLFQNVVDLTVYLVKAVVGDRSVATHAIAAI